jgi:hypothetical protein
MRDIRKDVPPEFPQPPIKALEVPTMFLSKKPIDQTWQGTKDPPRIPTKKRSAISPDTFVTNPAIAVGMEPARRMQTNVILGPKASQRGPAMKRTTSVPQSAAMLELATSMVLNFRSALIVTVRRGGNAYQDQKADSISFRLSIEGLRKAYQ